jgi:hypothetical protein
MTQRRQKLKAAKKKAAERVKAKILPVMRSQYKRLERFLRRSNLRKRLNKIKVTEEVANTWKTVDDADQSIGLYKVKELFKAPSPPKSDKDEWETWKKALLIALLLGLFASVDDIGQVENDIWESRGYDPLTFDPQQIIEDYQMRIGRNLDDIGSDTLVRVQSAIADWYMGEESLPELLDDLDRFFDEARAEAIAATEVGNMTSQIFLQEMLSNGWTSWYWDALGEDPCTRPIQLLNQIYDGCLDLNGRKFKVGTPMPPDAAHPHCQCIPMPADA